MARRSRAGRVRTRQVQPSSTPAVPTPGWLQKVLPIASAGGGAHALFHELISGRSAIMAALAARMGVSELVSLAMQLPVSAILSASTAAIYMHIFATHAANMTSRGYMAESVAMLQSSGAWLPAGLELQAQLAWRKAYTAVWEPIAAIGSLFWRPTQDAIIRERRVQGAIAGYAAAADARAVTAAAGLAIDVSAPALQYAALSPLGMYGRLAAQGIPLSQRIPTELYAAGADVLSSYGSEPLGIRIRQALVAGRGQDAVAAALSRAAAYGDIGAIQDLRNLYGGSVAGYRRAAMSILDTEALVQQHQADVGHGSAALELRRAQGRYLSPQLVQQADQALQSLVGSLTRHANQLADLLGPEAPETIQARVQVLSTRAQQAALRTGAITTRASEQLGQLAAGAWPMLLANAELPLSLNPAAHLDVGTRQREYYGQQMRILNQAARLLPPGPLRNQYLAQVAEIGARSISADIASRASAVGLQSELFELSQQAYAPQLAAAGIYSPAQQIGLQARLSQQAYGYYSGIAALEGIPASQRIAAQRAAYQSAAQLPGLAAQYYQIGYAELGVAYGNATTRARGMLSLGGLLGYKPYAQYMSAISDEASWYSAVANDPNAPWSTRLQASQTSAQLAAAIPGAAISMLGGGLDVLGTNYRLAAIRQAGAEQRLAMMPIGYGGMGIPLRGIQLRSQRLADIAAVRERLYSNGLLTPDMAVQFAAEEEQLRTGIAGSWAQMLYGAESKLPALMVNLNGVARFSAAGLAGRVHPYAALAYGGSAALANSVQLPSAGGQADPALLAKLDELISAVKQGLGVAGVPLPQPRQQYSEPVPEWAK